VADLRRHRRIVQPGLQEAAEGQPGQGGPSHGGQGGRVYRVPAGGDAGPPGAYERLEDLEGEVVPGAQQLRRRRAQDLGSDGRPGGIGILDRPG
jgi:hypothetical protein